MSKTNAQLRVYRKDEKHDVEDVIWEGLAVNVNETQSGALSVNRLFDLDGVHIQGQVALIAAGKWDRVEYEGAVFDLEMARQNQEAAEAQQEAQRTMAELQRRQSAQAALGLVTPQGR